MDDESNLHTNCYNTSYNTSYKRHKSMSSSSSSSLPSPHSHSHSHSPVPSPVTSPVSFEPSNSGGLSDFYDSMGGEKLNTSLQQHFLPPHPPSKAMQVNNGPLPWWHKVRHKMEQKDASPLG